MTVSVHQLLRSFSSSHGRTVLFGHYPVLQSGVGTERTTLGTGTKSLVALCFEKIGWMDGFCRWRSDNCNLDAIQCRSDNKDHITGGDEAESVEVSKSPQGLSLQTDGTI